MFVARGTKNLPLILNSHTTADLELKAATHIFGTVITYISKLYSDSISDKEIVHKCQLETWYWLTKAFYSKKFFLRGFLSKFPLFLKTATSQKVRPK